MGAIDRSVRNEAVTLRANIFGHNYRDETEYDLSVGAIAGNGGGYSDLCPLLGIDPILFTTGAPTIYPVNSIRVMQPHQGELVECYIDYFSIRYSTNMDGTPSHEATNTMKWAIGDFTNNDFRTPRTSYTPTELAESWQRISGKSTELAVGGGGDSRVFANRINLLPEIKKAGNAKFVEDGFNLLLCFNNGQYAPWPGDNSTGTYFKLEFLRIVMSITGVK